MKFRVNVDLDSREIHPSSICSGSKRFLYRVRGCTLKNNSRKSRILHVKVVIQRVSSPSGKHKKKEVFVHWALTSSGIVSGKCAIRGCSRNLPFTLYPPPPPPPTLEGTATRRLPKNPCVISVLFQVCHAFASITFALRCYSRSVEAHNCRSDRRETGTQIGQRGKTENCIGYQIRKPVNIFRENRKPNAKKRKMNTKNQ